MRVLHVIGAMDRGGAETMIMNAYRAVDRSRVQFDFLVHEQRECDYDAEIEALGGRVYRELPRFTGLNGREYRRAVRAFLGQHPEHSVIHGHIGSSAAIYLDEAKRANRLAIAHSHAQNYPLSAGELAFRVLSFPVRFKADYFLACSEQAGLDRFGRAVVESDRFHVLRNGINVDAFSCTNEQHERAKQELIRTLGLSATFCAPKSSKSCEPGKADLGLRAEAQDLCAEGVRKRSGEAGAPVLIGHVGRFDPVKNHGFLLEVFAQLKRELPDPVLLLVGRGPEEEAVRERARAAGIEDSVRFLGVTDDVSAVLRALDAFVLPSFREGLSMAAVEAQAAGAPCVLSSGVPDEALLPGTPKVRLPLDAGAEAWAQAVRQLVDQGETSRVQGAEAARAAGFDIRDTARWLQDFYEAIAHRA